MTAALDFFCLTKKDLVITLVKRNLKRKYRRSYLGFFWSLLVPLLTAYTYMVLFSIIMRIDVPHYLPMIVMNILTWTMFATSTQEGLESIFANYGILTKVPVPIHSFNFSTVVTNLINYLGSIPVIFFFLWIDGLPPTIHYIGLPFLVFQFFLVSYSMSVLLSILYVQFRDIKHLFGVFLQLWMYASPILYPISMLPENLSFLKYINPVAPTFVCLYNIMIEGRWPSQITMAALLGWTFVVLVVSYLVYRKYKGLVLENV